MVDESMNRKKQRKYVKYEGKHSNTLCHIDWSKYSDEKKLIIIEDDASRFIVGFVVFEEGTIDNTIETLVHAIELYGKPLEILTYHGTQFFSNGKNGILGDHDKFHEYLDNNGIKHIMARVDCKWRVNFCQKRRSKICQFRRLNFYHPFSFFRKRLVGICTIWRCGI